ncbi:nucleotide pyrophosphohydrolase [Desulfotalea psychrophila]|nr:nucleotide pyrophosphohydrolase [Desulfotalea psychrophila]
MDHNFIQEKLRVFAQERNWDQFHSPKNLAMALAGEAGELLEIFQWLTEDESKKENIKAKDKQLAAEELADIQLYLLRIADKLDINLEEATFAKLEKNAEKYPISLAKDNAIKYNRRDER